MPPRDPWLSHDRRILLMALASALPGAAISLIFLWAGDYTPKVQWTLTVLIVTFCLGFAFALRERVVLPLQTISNLLAALGEGDFSIRARGARGGDPLGEVMIEVNALVETLRHQRLDALEATTLLRKVMAEIDVAVFTFDGTAELKYVNRAGARLLGQVAERLLGRQAHEISLDQYLQGEAPRVINTAFPGGVGRWEVRRSQFRQGGRPHELLVLSDLSRPLREEERQAFQRLIRVIGHEMNNSLAPIKSIAGSLSAIIDRDPPPFDWREDVTRGLAVIASRSESLSRFMSAYARLAKLPPPKLTPLDVGTFVDRVVTLEKAHEIRVRRGPALAIRADGDQLEQLLINLIRNAVDAVREAGGGVTVGWDRLPGSSPPSMELWVEDEGPGLSNTGNLFVPFFTTKPGGSGIGLVLSRQIAEAHGGSLLLGNRIDRVGCRATLRVPLTIEEMRTPELHALEADAYGRALLVFSADVNSAASFWHRAFDAPADWQAFALALIPALLLAWLAARLVRRLVRRAVHAIVGDAIAHASPLVRGPLRLIGAAVFLLALALLIVPFFELVGLQPRTGIKLRTMATWGFASGLRVLLLAAVAYALIRAVALLVARFEHEINRGTTLDTLERAKRGRTLGSLIRNVATALIAGIATLMILRELGADIGPVLAGAGVVGLAVGFGAQTLVRDIISGFFLILEDQVRVGDVAAINGQGGLVEAINLRTIVLRDFDGTVHTFANGAITTLANRSKEFSFYVIDLGIPYGEDPDRVIAVLQEVGAALQRDDRFGPLILAPLEVVGVDGFGDWAVMLKMRIKTIPLKQWAVGRELRKRILKAFDEHGIEIPFPAPSMLTGRPAPSAHRDPSR